MVLEFLNEQLANLEVPYQFWEWNGEIPQTYFVGEYSEIGGNSEDGMVEGEIILSGFTRATYADLNAWRDKIYKQFRNGERNFDNGKGCVICYSHAMTVPSDVENVKRMEIYLNTFEWSD